MDLGRPVNARTVIDATTIKGIDECAGGCWLEASGCPWTVSRDNAGHAGVPRNSGVGCTMTEAAWPSSREVGGKVAVLMGTTSTYRYCLDQGLLGLFTLFSNIVKSNLFNAQLVYH